MDFAYFSLPTVVQGFSNSPLVPLLPLLEQGNLEVPSDSD